MSRLSTGRDAETYPLEIVYPVVMHRWFARGAGWAFHSSLTRDIDHIAAVLRLELSERSPGSFQTSWGRSLIVGSRLIDSTPLDPLSQARNPYIVVGVILPAYSSTETCHRVQDTIPKLSLPPRAGPYEDFQCRIEDPFVIELSSEFLWLRRSRAENLALRYRDATLAVERAWSDAIDEHDVSRARRLLVPGAMGLVQNDWRRLDRITCEALARHRVDMQASSLQFRLHEQEQGVVMRVLEAETLKPIALRVYQCASPKRPPLRISLSVMYE